MSFSQNDIQKFWASVRKGAPDECWEWQKCRAAFGYGNIRAGGRTWTAHRMSFLLHGGVLQSRSDHVRHTCDNPPCVNPAHLVSGSHADNMRDAAERGRFPSGKRHFTYRHPELLNPVRGTDHPHAKLTDEDVCKIRHLASEGLSFRALGRIFGVGHAPIAKIVRRLAWRHAA